MGRKYLPKKNSLRGKVIENYTLKDEVGSGNNGVVYKAIEEIDDTTPPHTIAIKLIPTENQKKGWEKEVTKVSRINSIQQVVTFHGHSTQTIDGTEYACIYWEFVNGSTLRDYLEATPEEITIPFIETVIANLLLVFNAMRKHTIVHGDLHPGNIMVAPDEYSFEDDYLIKVLDFGIGGSWNQLDPKDDYEQLASVCLRLLGHIDQSELDSRDRQVRDFLINELLPKWISEKNPTVGAHVKNPQSIYERLNSKLEQIEKGQFESPQTSLKNPFDYLSCEQISNSFGLLQKLYTKNFPGYDTLLTRSNTLLTGPRGCGKSTIFKNLSLKTQLLGGDLASAKSDESVGIYYHCRDLFFAFNYLGGKKLSTYHKKLLIHYFNLTITSEILDTCIAVRRYRSELNDAWIDEVETIVSSHIESYKTPPEGAPVLQHLRSLIQQKRSRAGNWVRSDSYTPEPKTFLRNDYIPKLCESLQKSVPWVRQRPFYFFLDDYSSPHISSEIQAVLNEVVTYRWPYCFFKISTESIVTFNPITSSEKVVEENREYDVIDLGSHFISKPTTVGQPKEKHQEIEERREFVLDVINNRLQSTENINPAYHDIRDILGPTPYTSYNELARRIKNGEHVKYAGTKTLIDLFSGDLADILRVTSEIVREAGGISRLRDSDGLKIPIEPRIQDKVIRNYGARFLERVEGVPESGPQLRKVASRFGEVAEWVLKNVTSKNENSNPPKQAFRIEILEELSFNEKSVKQVYQILVPRADRNESELEAFVENLEKTYRDLIRFGVFLRDLRGKSVRSAVVPRLYLRRLLIPIFTLTPNQRDNISLEADAFFLLLADPDEFKSYIIDKYKSNNPDNNSQRKLEL